MTYPVSSEISFCSDPVAIGGASQSTAPTNMTSQRPGAGHITQAGAAQPAGAVKSSVLSQSAASSQSVFGLQARQSQPLGPGQMPAASQPALPQSGLGQTSLLSGGQQSQPPSMALTSTFTFGQPKVVSSAPMQTTFGQTAFSFSFGQPNAPSTALPQSSLGQTPLVLSGQSKPPPCLPQSSLGQPSPSQASAPAQQQAFLFSGGSTMPVVSQGTKPAAPSFGRFTSPSDSFSFSTTLNQQSPSKPPESSATVTPVKAEGSRSQGVGLIATGRPAQGLLQVHEAKSNTATSKSPLASALSAAASTASAVKPAGLSSALAGSSVTAAPITVAPNNPVPAPHRAVAGSGSGQVEQRVPSMPSVSGLLAPAGGGVKEPARVAAVPKKKEVEDSSEKFTRCIRAEVRVLFACLVIFSTTCISC